MSCEWGAFGFTSPPPCAQKLALVQRSLRGLRASKESVRVEDRKYHGTVDTSRSLCPFEASCTHPNRDKINPSPKSGFPAKINPARTLFHPISVAGFRVPISLALVGNDTRRTCCNPFPPPQPRGPCSRFLLEAPRRRRPPAGGPVLRLRGGRRVAGGRVGRRPGGGFRQEKAGR